MTPREAGSASRVKPVAAGGVGAQASGILRPGPRLWLRALGWMIICFVVLGAILSLQSVVKSFVPNPDVVLAMAFVVTVLAYFAYAGLVRWGERRSPSELALRALPLELSLGILIGLVLFSAIFGVLWVSGAYTVARGNWTDWPHDIRETLGTGFLEELLFRLVVFRLLAVAFGQRWALALSAVAFGAAHLGNAHSTPYAAVAIAVEAGLLFAVFYIATGRIWMSVGVHAAWNFAQGAIFGARVSGMVETGSLLTSAPSPRFPAFWSGGGFGPEASLPAIVIGLLAFAVVLYWIGRKRAPDRTETGWTG